MYLAKAEALNKEANACKMSGDLETAVARYREALRLEPAYVAALYNLAVVLADLGQAQEAEECFRRVVELDEKDADALVHLGILLRARSRTDEAAALLLRAVGLQPGSSFAHYHLGVTRIELGDMRGAVASLRSALDFDPQAPPFVQHQLAAVHLALGDGHVEKGEFAFAIDQYSQGVRYLPESPSFADRLLFAKQQVCDWSQFDGLCALRRRLLRGPQDEPTRPWSLLSIESTPEEQLLCAQGYARYCERAVEQSIGRVRFSHSRESGPRIRIGYLSADFNDHVTSYVMAELLELHDRDSFEVFGYSCGRSDGSPLRDRIRAAMEHFVELDGLPDAGGAERVHADRIDILVDINGYTKDARTAISAMRPAPIQVNFLAFPGTMGAHFIDYVVVDRFLFRPGDQAYFSERPVLMPNCYVPNDTQRIVGSTPKRSALGLPENAFVFCCFNQPYKILPNVFKAWMRILGATPGSVLWLLNVNQLASGPLIEQARSSGVDPYRLIFATYVRPDAHLARLPAADLFLDTFPCNAHTTAADALWAGLPVLTRAGDTFASRVAGSMLSAIRLDELIATSAAEYEALAIRLARHPDELAALRVRLARNRASAPLFDMPRYTRDLELAYRAMWKNYAAGRAPACIEI